jgi:ABC-type transport system involved in cytochrome c biogenesis ATPase subunit
MELPPPPTPAPDPLVALQGATLGFHPHDPPVLIDVHLALRPGMRLLVLGPTGAGKSLLLRALAGHVAPSCGSRTAGRWVQLLHWDTSSREAVDGDGESPLDLMTRLVGGDAADALAQLDALGIDRFAARRPCVCLSSGERTLVALAPLAAAPKHLLLLDEPAMFLGRAAFTAVADALAPARWPGALVFTSSSRELCDALEPTHVVRIVDGKVHSLSRPPRDEDFVFAQEDAAGPLEQQLASQASDDQGTCSEEGSTSQPCKRSKVSAVDAVAAVSNHAQQVFAGVNHLPKLHAIDALCGRVCRAADANGFRTLHPDGVELKPLSWVIGGDGLRMLLEVNGNSNCERLRLLGFDDQWILKKLDDGETFRLALFPKEEVYAASWDGIFALVKQEFPHLAAKVLRHEAALRSTPFHTIQATATAGYLCGATYFDINEAARGGRSDDERYIDSARLANASCTGSLEEVRGWLYNVVGCSQLFDGCGYTRHADGSFGVKEYLVRNRPVDEFPPGAFAWVEIPLESSDI